MYKKSKPIHKVVTRVSIDDYARYHEYCISPSDVAAYIRSAEKNSWYIPKELKPVCNYPEMGLCFHGTPTEDQVKRINAKLAGETETTTEASKKSPEALKIKKGSKLPQYFCMNCSKIHTESDGEYESHIQHKRKKGRPKKK